MDIEPDGPPIPDKKKKMGRRWRPGVWPLVYIGSGLTGRDEWADEALPEAAASLQRNRKDLETLLLEAEREGAATRVEMLKQILENQERARHVYERTIFKMCDLWSLGYIMGRAQNGPKRQSPMGRFKEWVKERGGVPEARTENRRKFIEDARAEFGVSQRQVERYLKRLGKRHLS